MRLAVLGAFPFPTAQGSQVFAQEQARALAAAGAHVTVLCYGSGDPCPAAPPCSGSADSHPALEVLRTPGWLSPRRLRAGPSLSKPAADSALLALLLRETAQRRFDAVLAHNVEAALVGMAARVRTKVPVVYVAHTLARHELGSYAPARLEGLLAGAFVGAGRRIDAALARGADATLALTERAGHDLRPFARGPCAVIPPGLSPRPAPPSVEIAGAAARHGLAPGRYVIYAGNTDRYQDLPLLDAAAGALRASGCTAPVVCATHDPSGLRTQHLRIAPVTDTAEARALVFGAAVTVAPRRRPGGFPVKLLNYMEASRPIVAHAAVADGLVHERSAWLLPDAAGAGAMAQALRRLLEDPDLARRLGDAGRAHLERTHAWPALARRTLDLTREAARRRAPRR